MLRKKIKVVSEPKPQEVEVPVEEVVTSVVNNGVEVTVHVDRRDSGTNWNQSPALPSLDD